MARRLPPHPGKPGNRAWKRDASGKMVPDPPKASTAMRPMGIAVERTPKRKGANRGRQR
jgi:hypothetical protein